MTVSDQDKAKAQKWFQQARVVAETRNYDYAIECYLTGLGIWPGALEEGHMPLRAVGMARKQANGKPAGFAESFKRGTTGKDPLKNMLNAEFLLAKDPFNLNHMEQMFINASKAGVHATANWIGDIYFDALRSEKKVAPQRLVKIKQLFEGIGDELGDDGNVAGAVNAYEKALTAINILHNMKPDNPDYLNQITHLSGKLTISKGKYDQDDSFRESLHDRDLQAQLHDQDRIVQDQDRMGSLIAAARADYDANPDVASKLTVLVDMLLKREAEEDEAQAIRLLTENFERTRNYRFKMRADDIRLRQYARRRRELLARHKAAPDDKSIVAEAREVQAEEIQLRLACGKERVASYPTDHRIRFEYAQTLFSASEFDEAIPQFQAARTDPKNRKAANLFIGRCFFEKGHYGPSVDVLKQLAGSHEGGGDDVGKEVMYWLGRSHEADGKEKEAVDAYNQIIQWDYNYRDVRDRIDEIRKKTQEGNDGN
ncbi:MAG: tetratricopeptide repeat protein [Phycisphaerae bacterium]|nr:tetratricopeptide repeat protein [Phycisphaerae bacterium]